jgi:hypothetical protein
MDTIYAALCFFLVLVFHGHPTFAGLCFVNLYFYRHINVSLMIYAKYTFMSLVFSSILWLTIFLINSMSDITEV